jgi:hypothetical protein
MVNLSLLWLLLVPVVLAIATVNLLPRLSGGSINAKETIVYSIIGLLISSLIVTAGFYLGKGSVTADTEIWNGEITSKDRKHGHYLRSYQCNCREICSGSGSSRSCTSTCDTCYEDRYTVTWTARSTIGSFEIEHVDRSTRLVYNSPDPAFYLAIKQGDPCAKKMPYTNYIKAVPDTLFRPTSAELKAKFASLIPQYPLGIYNHYAIDRVLAVGGVQIADIAQWNQKVSLALRTLGPAKQANIVIVIANTDDRNYFHALRDAWINGKKNDIVVVIGATKFPAKADWVDVMALTDSSAMQIAIRDEIGTLDQLTADSVIAIIEQNIATKFVRKRMRDFDYLDAEIDPPVWLTVSIICGILVAYFGFWIVVATGRIGNRRRGYRFR